MIRHRKAHSSLEHQEGTFMEDLEQSLLNSQDLYGIDAFEAVFNKKKMLNQMINKERKLKQQAHQSYLKAKQRVAQIEQLQLKVDKQTSLLQSQVEKINDVHNMSKLLMMEKIIKLQRQTEQIQKRKNKCYEINADHKRSVFAHVARGLNKIENARIGNFSQTMALRQENENNKYLTLQMNRRKAQSVRLDRQRRQGRLQRIEQYKLEKAKSNYREKVKNLQQTISAKVSELGKLTFRQRVEQNHFETTKNVTNDYLSSFFATSTPEYQTIQ